MFLGMGTSLSRVWSEEHLGLPRLWRVSIAQPQRLFSHVRKKGEILLVPTLGCMWNSFSDLPQAALLLQIDILGVSRSGDQGPQQEAMKNNIAEAVVMVVPAIMAANTH